MSAFLVEPEALHREVERGEALVIDVRKPAEFAAGHIRGAVNFSTYDVLATDTSAEGLKALARDIATRYLGIGMSGMRPITVYEEDTGMRAAREAWLLQYLGHPHVRILHGGLAGWRRAGWTLSAESADDWTVTFRVQERADFAIGYEEVARRLGERGFILLDVRDAEEHAGRDKTPCCRRRGRIPGSTRIEWTEFLEAGRYKSPDAIRGLLDAHGIGPETEVVPYCHRGARSASVYYALKLAGLPKVRNYIGSWHEWSARADLPLEQG